MSDEYLTIKEAAVLLGVKPVTVHYHVSNGNIEGARLDGGGRMTVPKSAVIEYRNRRKIGRPVTTGAGLKRKDRRKYG